MTMTPKTQNLSDELRLAIATQGPMPFDQFMAACLYHPHFGYYMRTSSPLGREGDFITAPELTPAFGQTIAHSLIGVLDACQHADIVEVGAGHGTLAATILEALAAKNKLPRYYDIVDISPSLRQKQNETLKALPSALYQRVRWLDTLPQAFEGVLLANELLDALPITIYHWYQETLFLLGVTWDGTAFTWIDIPTNHVPDAIIELSKQLPDDYYIEYHQEAHAWIKKTATSLKKGMILCFDYGYEAQEYYHPQRTRGTLNAFYKHTTGVSPLANPGLQDLTCHVNFTEIQQVAFEHGLHVAGYTTQANFLIRAGICFPNNLSIEAQYIMAQAFKKLLLPSEMGELVKVIALTKNIDMPILGF